MSHRIEIPVGEGQLTLTQRAWTMYAAENKVPWDKVKAGMHKLGDDPPASLAKAVVEQIMEFNDFADSL